MLVNFSFGDLIKYSGKFSLYAGLILIAITAFIYIFDTNVFSVWFGLLSFSVTFTILIVFMYLGTCNLRDSALEGKINYLESLIALFTIGIIALLMSSLFSFLLSTVIDPEYQIRQLENLREFIYSNQFIPESEKERIIEESKKNINPINQLINSLKFQPFLILFMSLLMAFFIKKNKTVNQ